jgi:hypothetical protein
MGSLLSIILRVMRPTSVPQLAPPPETVNNTIWEQRNFDEAAISDGYGTDDDIVVECSTSPDDNPLYEAGAVLGLVLDFVGPGMLLQQYLSFLSCMSSGDQ